MKLVFITDPKSPLILLSHLFAGLASLGHLDPVLEGGLGQRLLRRHVVGVVLGVVKVPSPNGTLVIWK